MTRRIGNAVIVEPEADAACSRCERVTECRDVLGNGTQICFKCATPREKEAYTRRLFGDPPLS